MAAMFVRDTLSLNSLFFMNQMIISIPADLATLFKNSIENAIQISSVVFRTKRT